MNVPLLALAILATALFASVVLARARAFRHWLSASRKIRDDVVSLVQKGLADHQLRPLAPAIIQRLRQGRSQIVQKLARPGPLERLGLSIHGTLGQQIAGRLASIEAALGVASEDGCRVAGDADPRARHDLFFLLAMAAPLAVTFRSASGSAVAAAAAFGLWGALRLWNGKVEARIYQLRAVLDEIAIYSLAPIQGRSHQAATLDLVDRLGEAFVLVSAIPEKLSDAVAQEVSQGLEPACGAVDRLKGELASSYGNMSEALEKTAVELLAVVRNFGDTRLFEQWLEQMGTSVQAVADLGQRLDAYFDDATTAAGALHKVAAAVEQTQCGIAEQLRELSRLNQLRGVDEKIHAEKIFDLFRGNLEKIEQEHRGFRAVVDDFIRKVEQDGVVREALRSELPAVMSGLSEVKDSLHTLVDQAQNMPELYADVLAKIQEKAAANEKQLYQILHGMAREFQKDYGAFHDKVMAGTEALVRSLTAVVEEASRVSQARIAEQQAAHEAQTAALARHGEEMQQLLGERLAGLDQALNRFTGAHQELHRKFLEDLHRTGLERSAEYQRGVEQMTEQLAKLGQQAAHWDRIQTDVAKAQETLHQTLAGALTEAVGQGLRTIAEHTKSSQDQLAGLIAQVKTQTQRTGELEHQLAATLGRVRRATPVQIVQSALLAGILLALVLELFRIG